MLKQNKKWHNIKRYTKENVSYSGAQATQQAGFTARERNDPAAAITAVISYQSSSEPSVGHFSTFSGIHH